MVVVGGLRVKWGWAEPESDLIARVRILERDERAEAEAVQLLAHSLVLGRGGNEGTRVGSGLRYGQRRGEVVDDPKATATWKFGNHLYLSFR